MALIQNFLKTHVALIFLIPFSFLLVFTGLDDTVLQVDEGIDTFISTTILKYGYPKHSDGTHYTMPEGDVFDGIFLYRTWVPYYLQSISLQLFGQNTFSARLPFAILGVFSGLQVLDSLRVDSLPREVAVVCGAATKVAA